MGFEPLNIWPLVEVLGDFMLNFFLLLCIVALIAVMIICPVWGVRLYIKYRKEEKEKEQQCIVHIIEEDAKREQ